MPVTARLAYFDHAAVSPLPEPTRQAMAAWLVEATEQGDVCWPGWSKQLERLRGAAARLLTASPEEIALIPNTTTGIAAVAEGLPWQAGDNVVLPDNEFPSNLLPWLHLERRGVEVRLVPATGDGRLEIDKLAQAIDRRTRLVSVSWVGYATGFRLDLAQLCERVHARGSLLLVDAIQGLGVFPIDLQQVPIDFLAADGHKWLLGPEGAGVLFVRQQHLDLLVPHQVGWGSLPPAEAFSAKALRLRPNAARFEVGSANMGGLIGLLASMELLLALGANAPSAPLADAVCEQARMLVEQLQRIGARTYWPADRAAQSGIVPFLPPAGSPDRVRRHLLEQGVVLSLRGGYLRAAVHAYNDASDRQRLIDAVLSYSP
jgi:cysteine desulfurase / selenocysteine lyase